MSHQMGPCGQTQLQLSKLRGVHDVVVSKKTSALEWHPSDMPRWIFVRFFESTESPDEQ